jgi:hypothetical protein
MTEYENHYNTVMMETNGDKDAETQRLFDDIISTKEPAFRRDKETKISS